MQNLCIKKKRRWNFGESTKSNLVKFIYNCFIDQSLKNDLSMLIQF